MNNMTDMDGNFVEQSEPTSSLGRTHGETRDLQSQDQGQQGKAKKDRTAKLKVLKDVPKKGRQKSATNLSTGQSQELDIGQSQTRHDNSEQSQELSEMKEQLIILANSMKQILPVVAEMKSVFDDYQEEILVQGDQSEIDLSDQSADTIEPPNKRRKETETNEHGVSDVIADMAKSVKKANEMGPELHSELSEVVTNLLSFGMDKDAYDKVSNKYLTPKNCPRLEVVRVNPEIFTKVKKEAKLEDVHFQYIQKPLLKGITAVSSLLSSFMTEAGEQEISKQEIIISLKDAISLLTSASHKIDLRRRAAFKPFIKDDYVSLCSEQTPVEGLLFGTELGKSVKDLTEVSKLTSQLSTKRPQFNPTGPVIFNQFKRRQDGRRPYYAAGRGRFPFLGRGQGNSRQRNSSNLPNKFQS